jgi:hypothetical protein
VNFEAPVAMQAALGHDARWPRMTYPDINQARDYHAALKQVFGQHRTDWADRVDVLRRVEDICRLAAAAVDDAQCREEMGIVADYAAEIFSRGEYRKWESESMPGAEFLRLQILKALDSYHSRLYSIEAIRRAGERQATMAWRTFSEKR